MSGPATVQGPDAVEAVGDGTKQKEQTQAALKFVVMALFWSLLFLGLMRIGWIERTLLIPFTKMQATLAEALGWTRSPGVVVDLSCSGSDVVAMCLGAIVAYPVSRRARLFGCIGGLALIVVVNAARIGTLWHIADSPKLFDAGHVYIWPAVLMATVLGYLLTWIEVTRRGFQKTSYHGPRGRLGPVQLTPRFLILTAACVVVFIAMAPWYLDSPSVLKVAAWIATAAVDIAVAFGVDANAAHFPAGSLVTVSGNSFLVTQACIVTPLIPVGAAIALSLPTAWPLRIVALMGVGPIFVFLEITRLLALTVPETLIPSSEMLAHAYFQLVVAFPIVILGAIWRHGPGSKAWRLSAVSIGCALIAITVAGSVYTRSVFAAVDGVRNLMTSGTFEMVAAADPQSALTMLPGYQLALFTALWLAAFTGLGGKRFVIGVGVLALSAIGVALLLSALMSVAEYSPNVRYLRAWAVAAPIVLAILLGRPQSAPSESQNYIVA